MGESILFVGQLDANVVALDIKTGREVRKTPIVGWHNGYSITSAPLYYAGIVYSGISNGELGIRGRFTALDAKTGKILWPTYTAPEPEKLAATLGRLPVVLRCPWGVDLEYAGARSAVQAHLIGVKRTARANPKRHRPWASVLACGGIAMRARTWRPKW